MSSLVAHDSEDIIYYNVLIPNVLETNPSTNPIPCEYTETRNPPLLFNPNDWYMSILRFSIPAQLIPIFLFTYPSVQFPISPYSITLSYGGNNYQQFIEYVPLDNTQMISKNTSTTSEFYYYVYNYNDMLTYINTAFRVAFAQLKNDFPSAPATQPPFILFDPTTDLFSLYAQEGYDTNTSAPIQIYLGSNLERLFGDSFSYLFNDNNTLNGKDNQLLIRNLGNNVVTIFPPDIIYPTTPPPTWSATIKYLINDTVYYLGDQYVSLQTSIGSVLNLNQIPSSSPTYWMLVVPASPLPWIISKTYPKNAVVSYLGLLYYSINAGNTGHIPSSSPSFWSTMNLQLTNLPPQVWVSTGVYAIGTYVNYLGNYYINLTGANTGNPSTDTTDWALTNDFSYYQMLQDKRSIYSWTSLTSIVFVTNTIPVNNEYLKGLSNNNGVSDVFRPILTDFEPDLTLKNRDVFQYVPSAQYRYTELKGHTPLTVIQVSAYWQDNYLDLHQIMIPDGSVATIKFLFIKKTLLKYQLLKK